MASAPGSEPRFERISIDAAHVEARFGSEVTLSFHLAPTPVPMKWKAAFARITGENHAVVMAKSNPVLHGDVVVWEVSEGDIPNAKHFVADRVEHANDLYGTMLNEAAEDAAELRAEIFRELEQHSPAELDRLQQILDEA